MHDEIKKITSISCICIQNGHNVKLISLYVKFYSLTQRRIHNRRFFGNFEIFSGTFFRTYLNNYF